MTHEPKVITILTPRMLTRLELSKAIPPPDWWVVPENAEGWTEVSPEVLEKGSAPKCRQRQDEEWDAAALATPERKR